MWLFTQHGFYSVVVDGDDRTHLFVYARKVEHLENLKKTFEYLEDHAIIATPARDYPYHIRVKRSHWLTLAQDLAGDVRYTSFTSAASKHIGRIGPRYTQLIAALGEQISAAFGKERP